MNIQEPTPTYRMRTVFRAWRACISWLSRGAVRIMGILSVLFLMLSAYAYVGVYLPSSFFPVRTIITIPEGVTIHETAVILYGEQAVRSRVALEAILRFIERDTQVKAGDYYFDHPLTLLEVAQRVTNGVFGLEPIEIVVPEGATTYQMATLFDSLLERFDAVAFLLLTEDKEGYLFPDTYTFLPNANTTQVLETLEQTFYERLGEVEAAIASFGRPVHEVITMASLLEKEAWDHEERRIIAGVLWQRLNIDMPLQVDAVFGFIEKSETFSPKFSDLEVESPYNTYKNKGLPPGPIGSPSLSSIRAAITPVETDALFYLHGKDGMLHTAKDYTDHLVNRRLYLD